MAAPRKHSGYLAPSDVAVIVPIGGTAPAWSRSAESLARLDPAPGAIIAVIDGPNPALETTAREIGARVIVLSERGGPARARNHGVRNCVERILLFLDSDVEAAPDLVARVAALFSEESELSALMGSYDDAPGDPALVSQYRNLMHHFVHQSASEDASTFWAGCGAVRREAFDEVNGFDEAYSEPSIEDIELGARLRRAGHSIRLVKDLQVKHLKKWRLLGMLHTDLFRRAIPWTELMLGHGELVNDLNVKTRDRVSVALAVAGLALLPLGSLLPTSTATLFSLFGGATLLMSALVALNAPLFRFFANTRGWLFAFATVPLYFLYLLVCGLGFGLGLLRHLAGESKSPAESPRHRV